MSSIIGAQARSALPPEVPLKPVNARDSAASVEEPPADSGGIFGSLGKALSGRLSFASAEPEPVPLKEPVAAAPPPAEEAAKEEAPARTSFLESAGSVLAYPFSGGSSSAAPATEPPPPPQVEQQPVEPQTAPAAEAPAAAAEEEKAPATPERPSLLASAGSVAYGSLAVIASPVTAVVDALTPRPPQQAEVPNTVYIIAFASGTPLEAQDMLIHKVTSGGGTITQRYTTVMLGFAGTIPLDVLEMLKSHEAVESVEEDQIFDTQPVASVTSSLGTAAVLLDDPVEIATREAEEAAKAAKEAEAAAKAAEVEAEAAAAKAAAATGTAAVPAEEGWTTVDVLTLGITRALSARSVGQ